MQLVKPTKKYEIGWKEALKSFETESVGGFWNVPEKPIDLNEYIKRTKDHSQGKNLPDYWVQADTYWLIDKGQFIGHVNIRHTLTDKLKKVGGHIGYAIQPSSRKNGYGSKILELALLKAKKVGLQSVLITCNNSNMASQKIIEKHQGILEDIIDVEGKKIRRYWIEL